MIILFYMYRIITEGLEDILSSSFEFYKKLFGVDSFKKIQINFLMILVSLENLFMT